MDDSLEELSNSFNEDDEKALMTQFKTTDDVDPPHENHLEVLFKMFGHKQFRPMQWKIINSLMNDRRDNCAIMATGYGKSLCYQFPSVYCGGVTIVISPLISLMEDQVLALTVANIPACLLGTAQTQKNKVLDDIFNKKFSLVYVTPEFICGDSGMQLLKAMDAKLNINLIAVDEAHCISSWGHDFRHTYRNLATIRGAVPHIPLLAVTATATSRVRKDIIASLKLKNPQILYSGFDRPNLYFSVRLKGNNGILNDLRNVMIRQDGDWIFSGSTIIYCITRKHTEQIAGLLKSNNINCLAYHAGLTIKERRETHEKFVRDQITVIVATVAFGMGIDKPDVRNVVHNGSSKDIESYYQEVGRAGRDGQPANCTIFYSSADFEVLRSMREYSYSTDKTKNQKEAMTDLFRRYLETSDCRRKFILDHFEDTIEAKVQLSLNCCDNCTKRLKNNQQEYEGVDKNGFIDLTEYAHTFLKSMKVMGEHRGLQSYVLFIRGSKASKIPEKCQRHPMHGSGKHKSEDWWKCIGRILERDKYLEKQTINKPTFSYCTVCISEKGKIFIDDVEHGHNKGKLLIKPPPDMQCLLKKKQVLSDPISTSYVQSNSRDTINRYAMDKNKMLEHSESSEHNREVENAAQKEQRMNIYRKLLTKRTELAFQLDFMPYMIASNEVLMNLAQAKPRNVEELKQLKLDSFTDAKIERFGQEFINIICMLCPRNTGALKEILDENPVGRAKFTGTVETTYNSYKNGKSMDEIARERKMVNSTIASHLITCMKLGYPITLKDFHVSNRIKNEIIKIVKGSLEEDNKTLTSIKNQCSIEVSFTQINAVMAYLDINDHLTKLGYDYNEFERDIIKGKEIKHKSVNTSIMQDVNSSSVEEAKNENITVEVFDEFEVGTEDAALSALVDQIEKGGYLEEKKVPTEFEDLPGNVSVPEPPLKKQKLKMSLLDSPPRMPI